VVDGVGPGPPAQVAGAAVRLEHRRVVGGDVGPVDRATLRGGGASHEDKGRPADWSTSQTLRMELLQWAVILVVSLAVLIVWADSDDRRPPRS